MLLSKLISVIKNIIIKIDKKLFSEFFINFYKLFFLYFSKKLINKRSVNSSVHYFNLKKKNPISELCLKHGSDKGYLDYSAKTPYGFNPRNYSEFYFNTFHHFRENIKLVFECGLGTNNITIPSNMGDRAKPGASLKVWRDYFVNAEIIGADIDKDILFNSERIKTFEVDQTNKEMIMDMWNKVNLDNFDLIIDDGLHNLEGGVVFFKNSFEKLRKDGIYIIEDVDVSYLKKLIEELDEFNPEVIFMDSTLSSRKDNILVIFRKN